ncbi:MAG: ComEC/Rec2 family competence protein [Candidatus Buchananbacteria bacterium]
MSSLSARNFKKLIIAYIFGVGLVSFVLVDQDITLGIIIFVLFCVIIFWRQKTWRLWLITILFFLFGCWHYQSTLPTTDKNKIWFYNNQKVKFMAWVAAEPDSRIDHNKLTVKTENLILASGRPVVAGKVLVKTNLYPQYQYGDLLVLTCKLQKPEPIEDFNYDKYLAKDDIYSVCYYPKIELISHDRGNWFLKKIYLFKNYCLATISRNLPEPQASLFAAIILGARRGIPSELNNQFNITGTTHLIAISGFNISILSAILLALVLGLGFTRRQSFWLVSLILLVFIILIGFPASAVRAAIMGWLVILAQHVGRKNDSNQALILAAGLMIFLNPKILRDDAGFQLSFLAVLGLIYFQPKINKMLTILPNTFGLRESLSTTLAAQIATLPLIAYSFGRISLIAPIVNLLVLSVATYLTIFGLFILALAGIFSGWALFLFWPANLLLSYIILVVEMFSQLPWASINV